VLVARAPQQQILKRRIEFRPRRFEHRAGGQAPFPFHRVGHALKDVPPPTAQFRPSAQQLEAAFLERLPAIFLGDQQVRVKGEPLAQPVAFGTHALGAVEAEQLRTRRLETDSAVPASIGSTEDDVLAAALRSSVVFFLLPLGPLSPLLRVGASRRFPLPPPLGRHDQISLAELQRQLDRLGQSGPDRRLDDQPVHDHFDIVPHLAIQLQVVGQGDHVAIDACPDKALFQQVHEQIAILAFLAADQRGEYRQSGPFGQLQDSGDNLFAGLRRDRLTAFRAESLADAGEQNSQKVVDFRDRTDRRAGIGAGGLLRDRDRGAQAADVIRIGFRHLAQELAGKAGQTLHVPPLALGVQRVEGQRTLAGAADPGQTDQLVSRQNQIDVPQVMLASAFDDDIGGRHRR